MSTLGEAVVGVGADTSKFEGQVKEGVESSLASASKSMQNVGKKMTSVGSSLTMKVTAPLLGIAAASLKVAGEFESSMNMLDAATGMSDKAMARLEKQAKDLGASTVFSANEAADAMLELGKSGFNAAEISKAVPQVMNLAATEGLELANAAGIVSSALSQFSLDADDSAQVVNALAGASNASRSSVATLSESLKLVGSAASGIGLSVQETAGALAALSDSGLDGSVAGTSLAAVFNKLVPQTEKASGAMKDLGLDFTNAKGEFDSVDVIAGKLQTAFKGTSDEAKKVKLSQIFGNDASTLAAVNALISSGKDGLQDYTKAAMDQGAAQKLADARMNGLAGAVEKMKGSLETAALTIGQALTPVITDLAGFISNLADKFTNLSPEAQKMVIIGAAIAAALGPVLIVVGTLISSIGAITGVFAGVTAAVAAPVAIFALLAIGIGLLLAKSEKARAVVSGAFEEIKTAIMGAVGPIQEMIVGQLIPAFMAMWPILEKVGVIVLKVFAGAVVGAIKGAIQAIQGIVQVITGVVQVISGILTGDWSKVWDGLKNIVGGALDAVIGLIRVWLNIGVLGIFRKGFLLLTGVARGGWAALKGLFSKGVSGLTSVLSKVGQLLTLPFRIGFNLLKTVVKGAWAAIKAVFTVQLNVIKAVLTGNMSSLPGIVQRAISIIRSVFSAGLNALKGIASRAFNAVKGAVSNGISNAVKLVKGLPGKITGVITGAVGSMKEAGIKLIGGLVAGITEKIGDAVDAVKSGLGKIKGLLPGSPIEWGPLKSWNNGGAGKRLMAMLTGGIQSGIPGVVTAVEDATAQIARSFTDIETGPAVTAINDTFTRINEAISSATEARRDKETKAADAAFAIDKKRLEKQFDGKVLKKKLNALEKAHGEHLKEIEKKYKGSATALTNLANKNRATIVASAAAWDVLKVQLDGVRDELDKASSDLSSKIDEMLSYADGVGDRLVASVFKSDGDVPPTFDAILSGLVDQEAQAAAFGQVLADLAGMGLNTTSYDQIASAGPEALAAAQALVAAGQSGIAQVNALQGSIDAYAAKAGTTASNYLYGAGVAAAQGTVDGLKLKEADLVAQMTTLGTALGKAIAEAVKNIDLPTNKKSKKDKDPKHAAGVLSAPGGWSMVGERGRELVRLPEGSRVYPSHQTERMVQPAGQPEQNHFHAHLPTGDPEAAAMAMMNRFAKKGR